MKKPVLYPAAALFNARETLFNSMLVSELEKKGFSSYLPQRDGFEFGNLQKALSVRLTPEETGYAVQDIIYFLDVGFFVPKSDIILANLDEPIDEGVVVESSYGKLLGKYIIGFRTDVRTPYGTSLEPLKGMHFFPAYQCNEVIFHYMPCRNMTESNEGIKSLADKVEHSIANIDAEAMEPSNTHFIPQFSRISQAAGILFSGIKDIHSDSGLEEIVSRYIANKDKLASARPKIC